MKDKRNILKIACLLEVIYVLIYMIYYLFFTKFNDEALASIFIFLIDLFVTYMLYKESKKSIEEIKKNKIKVTMFSVWLFLNTIIPGILGFVFLSSISDKKKNILPEIKERKVTTFEIIKSIIVIILFIAIMFILPRFSFFTKIPFYVIYIVLFLLVFIANYSYLKDNFLVFIKNIKAYIPFIIKKYFKMLGIMIIVAIPVVILNNGQTSSNQKLVNAMFEKLPLYTLLLSCFYAPFTEENVFRLSLSKLFKNKTLFVIISGFLFGALHIIDKFTSLYDLLYIFQYSALGMCLAKAYTDSKNIFVPISMHFIQNFIAALLVLSLY